MRILVTGASGLVGKKLVPFLERQGHEVFSLVRRVPRNSNTEIQWDAELGVAPDELVKLENADAVVHLAGAGIADERWTKKRKQEIRDSRIVGTRVLVDALKKLRNPPRTLISASAIGYYGDRGDEVLTEDSAPGSDYLAEVSVGWEAQAAAARSVGMRVVSLRIGIVLSTEGGALEQMLPPFRMGAGGRVGSGKQFVSWIALDDVLRVIDFALNNTDLAGAVNTTAPNPVSNAEFAHILGHVLNRPSFVPVPEFALRLMFGELADALLLSSARVVPRKLQAAGFEFQFNNIEDALKHLLQN